MNKNPVLGAIVAAIFMVLSAVSSAEATKYFCFDYPGNPGANSEHLYLIQLSALPPSGLGFYCFEYWYDENAAHNPGDVPDAYTFAQNFLNEESQFSVLYIGTDIEFAGHDQQGRCNDGPNAFKGKSLELKDYNNSGHYHGISGAGFIHYDIYNSNNEHFLLDELGRDPIISGLCYESNEDDKEISFVSLTGGGSGDNYNNPFGSDAVIQGLVFSDVYFKLTGNGKTKAGRNNYQYSRI